MERDQFVELLRQEGFEQLVTVEREPNGALGACAAEGGEAKRAKNEGGLVAPTSPGRSPGRRR